MAYHFYKISDIKEKSYYKALAVVSIMNYKKTAHAILNDKVNKENIELVLSEWNDFMNHKGEDDRKEMNDLIKEINCELNKIKDDNV